MNSEDVQRLNRRAGEVGQKIGWELSFHQPGNPEYVCLAAGGQPVIGPAKVSAMAAHDIELELDALERGDRVIVTDDYDDDILRIVDA